jgi:hypothetical protein
MKNNTYTIIIGFGKTGTKIPPFREHPFLSKPILSAWIEHEIRVKFTPERTP